jgi:hypothetical protein
MKPLKYKLVSLGMVVLLAWLTGCFTEVGNAEDERLLKAQFKVDYSDSPTILSKGSAAIPDIESVLITQFSMLLHEAEYKITDSITNKVITKHIWAEHSQSDPIDFTGKELKGGPTVEKIGNDIPETFILGFTIGSHNKVVPNMIDYQVFNDIGYIKGSTIYNKIKTDFLFSLPVIKDLHLQYSGTTLMGWYKGNAYECEIAFLARKWLGNADFSKAIQVKDKNGKTFVLLDSSNNATLYNSLMDAFKKSFNTTRVF